MDEKINTNVIGDVKMELPEVINTEKIIVADAVVVEDKKVIEFTPEIKTEDSIGKDIFIEESDTFDIKVNYYKKDGKLIVENVDSEYDLTNSEIKTFTVTFKYPSYLDMQAIHNNNPKVMEEDQLNLNGLIALQNTRVQILIRKWSLKEGFEKFNNMNTKFMKAIRNLVSEEIGMEGIM